jgi:hypothetical protein
VRSVKSEFYAQRRYAICREFRAARNAQRPGYSDVPLETKSARQGPTQRLVAAMSQRGDIADMILGAVVYDLPSEVAQVQFHRRDR